MANAKRVPVEQYGVELTLSMEESETLCRILGNLSGGGNIRKNTSAMFFALSEAVDIDNLSTPFVGRVHLKEE